MATVELQPGTYVNKVLESSVSDVLFKLNYKKEPGVAYIYLLAEQQSSVEHLMSFRLLEYMTSIWRELIRKEGEKSEKKSYRLPLIIPLVFYTGPEKYHGVTDIKNLITAPPELIEKFLFKPFHLIDLTEIEDEEMKTRKWFGVVEFVMRHVRSEEILDFIQPLLELLFTLWKEGAIEFPDVALYYYVKRGQTKNPKRLKEILDSIEGKGGKAVGTLIDYLVEQNKDNWVQTGIEQGIERGIEQGIQKGEGTLLIRQLELKFKTVSEHYRRQIENASPDCLLKWGGKILNSQSIEEIFTD